jgi:Holliday junction resolvasome RuvABC DNA-binding subunit
MIVSLRGKLIESTVLRVVIESSGVGYEVNIPVTTAERLPKLGSRNIFINPSCISRRRSGALWFCDFGRT